MNKKIFIIGTISMLIGLSLLPILDAKTEQVSKSDVNVYVNLDAWNGQVKIIEKQVFWKPRLSIEIDVPESNINSIPVTVILKNHGFLPLSVGEMDLRQLCDCGRTLDFEIVTPDHHIIYFMGGHLRKTDYRVWLLPFGKIQYSCDLSKKCFGEKEEECYPFLDHPGTYTIKAFYNSDGNAFVPYFFPRFVSTWEVYLESEIITFEIVQN